MNMMYRSLDSWRWAYGIGSIYSVIVLFLIVFFMDETCVLIPLSFVAVMTFDQDV